ALVPLLDTSYNRDLLPGLEAGLYGASFRFRVTREDMNNQPERSDYNPEGIPERTIREVELREFGPVTFPAYAGTSVGLRSVTDEFVFGQYLRDREKLRELVLNLPATAVAPPEAGAEAEPHPSEGRRDDPPAGIAPDERPVGLPVFRNPHRRRKPRHAT
ncbi:MAG: HK97 family phage prohead protease, partial [Candidatus Dormibacteraeota bacterium]|nr:HK97 family phage prohead protease [Candidatus Dormibacteraeota bacterium]